jgi:dolichol-phosphate mannosyltransferase
VTGVDFTPPLFPVDWEVPSFQTVFWNGKIHPWCVVVPVINEGERITSFLSRLSKCGTDSMADIIIIDGGSTDGSLQVEKLVSYGVKGLLLKTGAGKLSAQLQCAYAFAVVEKYEGIITIDGNDKDDPQSIPSFIQALENGYDFVQASRFIKGGYAENTPLARYIAIRLLHAPVLSLASGFRWTDTTQGYRAYSSKMLLDPQIKPFRRIFKTYELLAYLSYRVPKLGYRCIEKPTARKYPRGEVPTKISSFRGNLQLIKILFSACLKKYNPDSQP